MLLHDNYTREHIDEIRQRNRVDPTLLERSIYAMGLLEALARVGMPFIFKGGTCLMLLLERPRRLSTDIDIIVAPGTELKKYLDKAAEIFPFTSVEQQVRKGKNSISKEHYKFTYTSPLTNRSFFILLDVLYEDNHYETLVQKRIDAEILLTEEPYVEVTIPSVNCILGDKLTAFAPHTTGIPFGINKELEIIKQMYDVATLADACDHFTDVIKTYHATVATEIGYRGVPITGEDALIDTIETAACIAGRGKYNAEEYPVLLEGIKKMNNFVYGERFSGEAASYQACKVMYLAACVLKETAFEKVTDAEEYLKENIGYSKYSKLSTMRKLNAEAFSYIVKAVRLLEK